MIKMTGIEVKKFVSQQCLNWDDRSEVVRYCADCDSWVHVDDFCGTRDRCDECDDSAGSNKYGDLVSIARENGISDKSFYARISRGLTPEQAATTPKMGLSDVGRLGGTKSKRRKLG